MKQGMWLASLLMAWALGACSRGGEPKSEPHGTQARLRIVAALHGKARLGATTSDGLLATTLQAPSIGSYATVSAALPGLVVKVNGVAIDTGGLVLAPGSDATLLVYGEAAAARWRLLVDDKEPVSVDSHARLRPVAVLHKDR
jgi:hypothetical protein